MFLFYLFALIETWLGLLSLRGGIRFSRYVHQQVNRALPRYTPFASVIAPYRGLEDGLYENIQALFRQDYPAYEIILVTDKADDRSMKVMNQIVDRNVDRKMQVSIVIAGEACDTGQKVHNLRAAIGAISAASEVLVFVDSDARPASNWLRSLVAPLADHKLGATTGYRWFIPIHGGFASHLRSVWNASITSSLGAAVRKNFCWGGSTAISREKFESLQVREGWRGTVSDDFTITRVLQKARLPIHFVPECMVASPGDCSFKELIEFSNRQLKITRTYAPHLWKLVFASSFLFSLVFFGGISLVLLRAMRGLPVRLPVIFLCLIFVLGALKSAIRWWAVSIPLRELRTQARGHLPAHIFLWPLASFLYFCNAVAATFSRVITWRGITYELKSPTEAVIISREW